MPAEYFPPQRRQIETSPESLTPAIPELLQTFRYHAEPHQLENIVKILESPQLGVLDPEVQAGQREVLSRGTLHGKPVEMSEVMRGSQDEIDERLFIARTLIRSPETAETLVEKEVAGFHATNSFGLAGIIESGAMYPAYELYEQGKPAKGTGDAAVDGKGQDSISFGVKHKVGVNIDTWGGPTETLSDSEVRKKMSDDLAQIEQMVSDMPAGSRGERMMQAALHNAALIKRNYEADPDSLSSTMLRHRFPVVVGVSANFLRAAEESRTKGHLLHGERYFGEFRTDAQEIPIESLPVIGVPRDQVQATGELLRMFKYDSVRVVALEDLRF